MRFTSHVLVPVLENSKEMSVQGSLIQLKLRGEKLLKVKVVIKDLKHP